MKENSNDHPPFPLLVDLGPTSWPFYAAETSRAIATRNNSVVARMAHQRLGFGDHIYGYPSVAALPSSSS